MRPSRSRAALPVGPTVVVVLFLVSSLLAACSDSRPPARAAAPSRPAQGSVAPDPLELATLDLADGVRIVVPPRAAAGTIRATIEMGSDDQGHRLRGVRVDLGGQRLRAPLTVRFPAPPLPRGHATSDRLVAAFVHRLDDGRVETVPASRSGGLFVLRSREFSWWAPTWIDPVRWLSGALDSATDALTGRTDPDPCPGERPSWATLERRTTLLHTCLTGRGASTGSALVRLQSNRRVFLAVALPPGVGTSRVEEGDQLLTAALARASWMTDPGSVLVPPQARLATTAVRPQASRTATFTASIGERTALLSLATSVIAGVVPSTDDRGGLAALWAIKSCAEEIPRRSDDVDGWWHALVCVFADALPQLADPERAVRAAADLLGHPDSTYTREGAARLQRTAGRLRILGRVVKAIGLVSVIRDEVQQMLDAIPQWGRDRPGDVLLRLEGRGPLGLAALVGEYVGHTRLLRITPDGRVTESIDDGCCEEALRATYRIEQVRRTAGGYEATARVLSLAATYEEPDMPPVGTLTRLVLSTQDDLLTTWATGYCGDRAPVGYCGA